MDLGEYLHVCPETDSDDIKYVHKMEAHENSVNDPRKTYYNEEPCQRPANGAVTVGRDEKARNSTDKEDKPKKVRSVYVVKHAILTR